MTTPTSDRTRSGAPAVDEKLLAALSTRERPPRPNPARVSLTFGWRALLKIKHVPEQLFDVTMFPIMFTLMFTYLFGGALAGSPREYVQDLLPGILVLTVAMITMYTGLSINKDINKGVFDRFRSLPIWRPAVLVGALFGDVLRYTLASLIVIGLGLLLGFRPGGGAVGVIAAVALLLVFAFSLSWIWTALGFLMRTEESLLAVSMMILFPLTFISNVFVDPETMPGWLQAFVEVNPITHLSTASRGLMHGDVDPTQVVWVLIACAVFVAVFGPLTMRMFRKKQ
jgi:ABC-2 type transport system permease protein